jgi:hypothetical protein
LVPGTRLGAYEILTPLGAGGMLTAGGPGLATGVKLEIREADLTMLVRTFGQVAWPC